jgi:uncharacterized membrane protein HdeD (DUF308 family)
MKVVTIVLGILLLVGGIYCMFAPVATYSALGWIIGASMLIEGVGSIITWSDRRRLGLADGWTLAGSIVSIILGLFLLGSYVLQFAVDMFIAYVIAIWLVFAGIARIAVAISIRNSQYPMETRSWIGQLVLGVLIVILGILCIFNPLSIVAGVGLLLGMSIVLVGAGLIASGFRM